MYIRELLRPGGSQLIILKMCGSFLGHLYTIPVLQRQGSIFSRSKRNDLCGSPISLKSVIFKLLGTFASHGYWPFPESRGKWKTANINYLNVGLPVIHWLLSTIRCPLHSTASEKHILSRCISAKHPIKLVTKVCKRNHEVLGLLWILYRSHQVLFSKKTISILVDRVYLSRFPLVQVSLRVSYPHASTRFS